MYVSTKQYHPQKKHYQPGKQIEHTYEVAQMIKNTNEKTTQKPKKENKNTSFASQ